MNDIINVEPKVFKPIDPKDPRWALLRTPIGNYLACIEDAKIVEGLWMIKTVGVFDYYSQIGPGPSGQLQRQVFCLPFDNCVYSTGVLITTNTLVLRYLKEMDPEDAKTYEGLIEAGNKIALSQRAGKSGLSLVGKLRA